MTGILIHVFRWQEQKLVCRGGTARHVKCFYSATRFLTVKRVHKRKELENTIRLELLGMSKILQQGRGEAGWAGEIGVSLIVYQVSSKVQPSRHRRAKAAKLYIQHIRDSIICASAT